MLPILFVSLAVLVVIAVSVVLAHEARRNKEQKPFLDALRFAGAAAAWGAVWVAVASTGVLARVDVRPPPFAGVLLGIGVATGAVLRSAVGRRLTRAPVGVLIGLQAFRLPLELLMARAAELGLMPVQMSLHGRNFDVVTGVLATIIGLFALRFPVPRAVGWGFSVVGGLLLVNIVTIAVLSSPMIQAFGDDPSVVNTFVTRPPYVLLPTVLVTAALVLHLALFARLLRLP